VGRGERKPGGDGGWGEGKKGGKNGVGGTRGGRKVTGRKTAANNEGLVGGRRKGRGGVGKRGIGWDGSGKMGGEYGAVRKEGGGNLQTGKGGWECGDPVVGREKTGRRVESEQKRKGK